jgi:hypothetical protein
MSNRSVELAALVAICLMAVYFVAGLFLGHGTQGAF